MSFRYGVMNDEERKKEKEQKLIDRNRYLRGSIFQRFDFPTLSKVSGTFQVVLHLDSEVLLVYGLFALLLTRLGVRAPIPYVQDAILNRHFDLRHPYIVVATATTDDCKLCICIGKCTQKSCLMYMYMALACGLPLH